MDSPDHRRKRKRFLKTTNLRHFPTVRSLTYAFSFFAFFYIVLRSHTTSFHHVMALSRLSSTDSYPIDYHSFRVFPKFNYLTQFKLESRVSFPDHVLLLVSKVIDTRAGAGAGIGIGTGKGLECVYRSNNSDSISASNSYSSVLSVDEYEHEYYDRRLLVRCPIPTTNFSSDVTLRRRGLTIDSVEDRDKPMNSWENLAYEGILDGCTVVVFVKGISHRQDKESDPNRFNCHFRLADRKTNRKFTFSSKALTAAQEIVRCVVPEPILLHLDKGRGIDVTVGFHDRSRRVLVPSVARLLNPKPVSNKNRHDLCVCTMLWNQADSIREWITYHSWLGVEKWFIYDNNSNDNIKSVINNLNTEGYNVTRHVWPWIKTQEAGFSHCALQARPECNWVSFMDVDEFYYFPNPGPNHGLDGSPTLRTLVRNASSSTGEIRTACHSFGPSGLTARPNRVTVGYTCRLQNPERHKSIVRLAAIDSTLLNVVHHFHLRKGFDYVDVHQSIAVINHYKYQVWEAFRAKFYRRVATYVADWRDNQNEGSRDRAPGLGTEAIEPPDWRLRFCEVWDTGLRDFVLGNLVDISTGVLPWD